MALANATYSSNKNKYFYKSIAYLESNINVSAKNTVICNYRSPLLVCVPVCVFMFMREYVLIVRVSVVVGPTGNPQTPFHFN